MSRPEAAKEERLSEAATRRRMESALKWALATPHEPHTPNSKRSPLKGKSQAKRKK